MARRQRRRLNCFQLCKIKATFVHSAPDGKNINESCGALHPETVAKAVAEKPGQFDLGITFDGDADRVLFCDANGNVVNGDAVILLAARHMKSQGTLPGETVVATTMSNMGLEIALRNSGVRMLRANVGDKYVLEEMQKSGCGPGRRTVRAHYFPRRGSHYRRWSADRAAGDGDDVARWASRWPNW